MNLLLRARIKTRRELAQQGFGPLYEHIHQILLNHNPAGLDLTRGDARDDYGSPVGTLIPKLRTINEADLVRVLYLEMQHWYPGVSGEPESYGAIADEIWQVWTEFQRRGF